jgi:hypothetical protein
MIDTQLKRMSAISRRLPWMRRFTPVADGSVDQADRQHVAMVYRGVLAGEPAGQSLTASMLHPLSGSPRGNHTLDGCERVLVLQ